MELQLVQIIVNVVVLVVLVPIWRSQDRIERRFNSHIEWHMGGPKAKAHD